MGDGLGPESKGGRSLIVPPPPPSAAWWLPGPHFPTIYAKFFRTPPLGAVAREEWKLADGDTLTVLRVRGTAEAPRVVVFHGLEGGAHSTYARRTLGEAARRGWWADLVLWRTCDGRAVNDVPRTYHSGASDDAEEVVARVLAEDGGARATFLFGVSLGANVMLKWLGERGTSTPAAVHGSVAVSTPFDLGAAARQLEHGFSTVYNRYFLRKLRDKAFAKLERFPGLFDAGRLARARTLREFDDAVTAPIHGFRDADDYYARSSSIRFLETIAVPTLLVSAWNDPFLPRQVLADVRARVARNPYIGTVFPEQGGHVGFVSGRFPWAAEFWLERYCLDWLAALHARQQSRQHPD